jgi:hypothetical protein
VFKQAAKHVQEFFNLFQSLFSVVAPALFPPDWLHCTEGVDGHKSKLTTIKFTNNAMKFIGS